MNVESIIKKIHRLCEAGNYEMAEELVGRYQSYLAKPEWADKLESVPRQMLEHALNPASKNAYKGTYERSQYEKKRYIGTYMKKDKNF